MRPGEIHYQLYLWNLIEHRVLQYIPDIRTWRERARIPLDTLERARVVNLYLLRFNFVEF